MPALSRRIASLEHRRPAKPTPGKLIVLADLNPEVSALFLARDCDTDQMTLAELEALEKELLRFTE